jgi:helicase
MISSNLSLWIAQSESWQTFIDFSLPEDSIARYSFLGRADDFYISLFGQLYDILEDPTNRQSDILSIAKGLEIFSLKKKREFFRGVNQENNILIAAGLYYLADYSSSALILGRLYQLNTYETDIEKFLLSFFQRKLTSDNRHSNQVIRFLNEGNTQILNELVESIELEKNIFFQSNAEQFTLHFLAEMVLRKFLNNNIWIDLLKHNLREHWIKYVQQSISKPLPVWDFFPSQLNALDRGVLAEFKSVALQTPTSSGKTAICELIIYNEYQNNRDCKILYLAPFRALASELKNSFGRNLAKLGISSKTIYGGNIPTSMERDLIQNVSLLISTPEKFIAIENSIPNFLSDFTLIICDEGHLLDDGNRGLSYELLLSRLKNSGPTNRKFIYISAIIPNIGQINSWLGGDNTTVVKSTYRATEIEYGFLKPHDTNGTFILDVNPFKQIPQKYLLNNFLTPADFSYQGPRKIRTYSFSSIKTRAVAVALKSLNSGTVALFSPTKGGNSGVTALANELIKQMDTGLKLPNPVNYIDNSQITIGRLQEYFKVILGEEYTLYRAIKYGVLYHHGDLPQYVREVIEDAIRTEKVRLIICTNTLAEGVNLPIRTIVISSVSRFDAATERRAPLELRDIKNLVGRAGRAGKETKGLVIVANPSDFYVMENVIKEQNLENVNGFLFTIVSRISKIVIEKRLVLTNELLEQQNESFKELIDAIDVSIIDLVSEEIKVEQLEATVRSLIDQTFAKFQANDEQSGTLSNLVTLRGQKLESIIESNEFRFLKQSGANLRIYLDFRGELNVNNPLWQTVADPIQEDWLTFILDDFIFKQSSYINKLNSFNLFNRTSLSMAILKEIIRKWMTGSWFGELSKEFNLDMDVCLRIVNSLICFNTQNIAAAIIRNVELRLSDQKIAISLVALNFSQYLLYGLQKDIQLRLIEIGFNDRISIIALSDLILATGIEFNSLNELRSYLTQNEDRLILELQEIIPIISLDKTKEAFGYLTILNMN